MLFGSYFYPHHPHLYTFACCHALFGEKTDRRNSDFRIGNDVSSFRYRVLSAHRSRDPVVERHRSHLHHHSIGDYFFLSEHQKRTLEASSGRKSKHHHSARKNKKKRNVQGSSFHGRPSVRVTSEKHCVRSRR